MPRQKSAIPSYSFHKPSGQARVRIDGRTIYLGKFNSPESRAEYSRIVAELVFAAITTAQAGSPTKPLASDVTVNEVLVAFWDHAQRHYRRADGTTTNELNEYCQSLRPVKELYGHTPAREFGPLALDRGGGSSGRRTRTTSSRRGGRARRSTPGSRFGGWRSPRCSTAYRTSISCARTITFSCSNRFSSCLRYSVHHASSRSSAITS